MVLIYSLASVICLMIYFNIKESSVWMGKIEGYYAQRALQIERNPSIEQQLQERHGFSYQICKAVKNVITSNNLGSPILLLEPNSYIKQHKTLQQGLPEPIVFYYFSDGVQTAWMNSPFAKKATHLLKSDKNQVYLVPIKDSVHLNQILELYKPYPVSL